MCISVWCTLTSIIGKNKQNCFDVCVCVVYDDTDTNKHQETHKGQNTRFFFVKMIFGDVVDVLFLNTKAEVPFGVLFTICESLNAVCI